MSLTPHELRSIAEEVVATRRVVRVGYAVSRSRAEQSVGTTLRVMTRRRHLDLATEAERVRFLAVTVAMGRELDRLVLAERAARAERWDDENGGGR